MDTVGPSNGRLGWAASAAPRPQEHALWPALNGPAAGCSFYFRRWIKSNLGTEAVVGGTGQWQPPRSISFHVLPRRPPEVLRGLQGRVQRSAQGCAEMLRGAQRHPPPGLPPRLPSRGCWRPTLPSSAAGAQGQPGGIASPLLRTGGPGPVALDPVTPLAAEAQGGAVNLRLFCQNSANHMQPCHRSCFVPRVLKGLRNVQIALLKSKILQLPTSSS